VKKKIIACIYIIMMLVASKLAFNYIYNEYMISQYDKGNYDVSVQPIFSCNWVQPYVPHYNAGNMYYDKGEYKLAIKEYKQALKRESKNHLCDIRVNIALSMIGTLPEEYGSEENIESTVKLLTEAREILIQDGCASEKGDGHDEDATKLKKEIDSILESMKNGQGSEPGGEPTEPAEPAEPSTESGNDVDEDDIKNKLQQQQKNGFKEREENEQYYKEDEWGEYMDKPVW
jgi:tetratricopeptide (TPR) repeat protein